MDGGRIDEARHVILDDLDGRRGGTWWPPHAARPDQLNDIVSALIDTLPEPNADHRTQSAIVIVDVLLRTGHHQTAADYGARVFALSRSGHVAIQVARGTAALGDDERAAQWLTVAARSDAEPTTLLEALLHAPEFDRLRLRPEIAELIRSLGSPR